jgi:UDP-N-acetylmuramoylalanine--D-glutamate ligase
MKVAVAGYGLEGQHNYQYWKDLGHDVTIVDQREIPAHDLPYGTSGLFGDTVFEQLQDFDLVVRTAGLAPHKIKTNGKIWSATNEFFQKCPAPIIGVTGSKGKGTTASFVTAILTAAGHTVHLVGNIGVSALAALPSIHPNDIVVYELSSFQLWDLQASPSVAVVLYIEPEHLDVHKNLQEYVEAKANITRRQSSHDILVFNGTNDYARQIAHDSKAARIPYQHEKAAHVADGAFWFGDKKICSIDALQLPGSHNQDNVCAAISAAWRWVKDPVAIEKGIKSFTGLAHRLKFVKEVAGVKYYDDSIATTPGSAIAAIRAFGEQKVLILGGSSKGANFKELAHVARDGRVSHIVAIGEEAPKIVKEFKKVHIPVTNLGSTVSMDAIVEIATEHAQVGDIVILSPACASFGMFRNYADRGDQFIATVQSMSVAG